LCRSARETRCLYCRPRRQRPPLPPLPRRSVATTGASCGYVRACVRLFVPPHPVACPGDAVWLLTLQQRHPLQLLPVLAAALAAKAAAALSDNADADASAANAAAGSERVHQALEPLLLLLTSP